MLAVGCLIPFALMAVGGAVGGLLGGVHTGVWAGIAGLGVGLVSMVFLLAAFERSRSNLPD